MKPLTLLCVLALFAGHTLAYRAKRQSSPAASCTNQNDGASGQCIKITDCSPLYNLLLNGRQNTTAVQYLRRSVCRREGNTIFVCCPSSTRLVQPGTAAGNDYSNLPSPPKCGVPSNGDRAKIVGGTPAEAGAWPWAAALGYVRSSTGSDNVSYNCGGTLISERYVITAAHCLTPASYRMTTVRLGALVLNSTDTSLFGMNYRVERLIPFGQFNEATRNDDIGLVKLAAPVSYSDFIKPICLPKTPTLMSKTYEGTAPFVVGWGRTSWGGPVSTTLMQVQIPIVDNESCRKTFDNLKRSTLTSFRGSIERTQICAGFKTGGRDSCSGDSGGPLMIPDGPYFYLIGIVSFGYRCGEPNYPGIYTRVTEYINWINTNIAS